MYVAQRAVDSVDSVSFVVERLVSAEAAWGADENSDVSEGQEERKLPFLCGPFVLLEHFFDVVFRSSVSHHIVIDSGRNLLVFFPLLVAKIFLGAGVSRS